MGIVYDIGTGDKTNWIVGEQPYDPRFSAKSESIFALGNGYMGLRAATEEHYAGEARGFYVAGVFDAFPGEVTELANLPDWLDMEIEIEGERFSCLAGTLHSYLRFLDIQSGRVDRRIEWESPSGKRVALHFERFVSMDNLHLAVLRVTIKALNFDGRIRIVSGINGQVTNSGVQHFKEGDLRLLPGGTIASTMTTQQSDIGVCLAAVHRYTIDDLPVVVEERVNTGRRRIDLESNHMLRKGQTLTVVKYASTFTERDSNTPAHEHTEAGRLLDLAASNLEGAVPAGFDAIYAAHERCWEKIWGEISVEIAGPDFDQLAIRFALFHLLQMTPRQDPSLSIAAKGLTGEGYKGHVFWDTEIFILPFFTFVMPNTAATLLEYRFRTLDGARAKAKKAKYRGAMYAWESAVTGEETTPTRGAVDVVSGVPIPILSGDIEQHISVDIPFAVWQYYLVSGDDTFMLDRGLEIMLETARFWASRLEWNEEREQYEITGIMGPDEYGERISNNAYTNYMVSWHLRNTAELFRSMVSLHPIETTALRTKIDLQDSELEDWTSRAPKIVVNIDPRTGFIEQYDGFAAKKPIDLAKYQGKVGSITKDYGWEELMTTQVVKQADTIMLLHLRGDDFPIEAKLLNWGYYEPKTLHDSSLSPAIHSIVAAEMGDGAKAYGYFRRASGIDLGPEPDSSDAGLHAASLGGIWQAVVNGFGGVRTTEERRLAISPRLARDWERLAFPIVWHGTPLDILITRTHLAVTTRTPGHPAFELECNGQLYSHPGTGTLEIAIG